MSKQPSSAPADPELVARLRTQRDDLLAAERGLRPELRQLDAEISRLSARASGLRAQVTTLETRRLTLDRELHRLEGRIQYTSKPARRRGHSSPNPVDACAELLASMSEEQIRAALDAAATS